MNFVSSEFLLLASVTFAVYYLPILRRAQVAVLVAASLVFYGRHEPHLVALLAASVVLNAAGGMLASQSNLTAARCWLTAAVAANLLLLGFFKYTGLLVRTARPDAAADPVLGLLLHLPLPIGISFFTFEGVSLCVDSFRSRSDAQLRATLAGSPARRLLLCAFFLSFFPHLVAGPILRAGEFLPQVGPKRFRDIAWEPAFRRLVLGCFLKMVVADNLRDQTQWMDHPYHLLASSADLVGMLLGYSLQIFADFAGYSHMAVGLGLLFGYRLPDNFRFPYVAESFADFWRRWHITLSAWLRDYLYIPLGGSRAGRVREYVNLLLVMFLGGLWHGAAWSYAVWGTAHGAALAIERALGAHRSRPDAGPLRRTLYSGFVFLVVTLAWLLFRLPEFGHAVGYVAAIGDNLARPIDPTRLSFLVVYSLPVVLYHAQHAWAGHAFMRALRRWDPVWWGLMLMLVVVNSGRTQPFIYFQF
jgi:alginate O-acetyltransferase complex protein AlgI